MLLRTVAALMFEDPFRYNVQLTVGSVLSLTVKFNSTVLVLWFVLLAGVFWVI